VEKFALGGRALELFVIGHRSLKEGMPLLAYYRPRDAWDGLRELRERVIYWYLIQ